MSSRIKISSDRLFDCFFEICQPSNDSNKEKHYIIQKYPAIFNDEEIIKSVPQFCYPCKFENKNVIHFSFVLTSIDSKWNFGFIRHPPYPGNSCLVMLSYLPWHDTFYKILNHIALLHSKNDILHLNRFLEALYITPIPSPGLQLQVSYFVNAKEFEFIVSCPDITKIPSIPEDRNLSEYFNAIDSNNMIIIFASMLNERRILITSKKLSRLSACVQAANSLIYPMHWQHIFIPVLPSNLLDYLSAPMPFLIGVPSPSMNIVKHSDFGDIVVLDADNNKIESPFDDANVLPYEIVSFLKRSLKNSTSMIGDGVSRTFLKALVMLIGGYREALKFTPGEKITFDKDAFIHTRPANMQHFLSKMLHLQIFHQFIEDRLQMLNQGEGFCDEFEFELNMYEDRSANKLKSQYDKWASAMKKEGGAFLKSVNPVVKSAYKHVKRGGKRVKDQSKRAYQDLRSKFQDIQKSDESKGSNSSGDSPTDMERSRGRVRNIIDNVHPLGLGEKLSRFGNNSSESLKMNNGSNNSTPFSRDESRIAPEASSEDSEIDSVKDIQNIDNFKYDPIDTDLMGDLKDVITNYVEKCTIKDTSPVQSCSVEITPLVPPRRSRCKPDPKENLIKLDSSPEDEIIFDPLIEKNVISSNTNTNPISVKNEFDSYHRQGFTNAMYFSSDNCALNQQSCPMLNIPLNPFKENSRNKRNPRVNGFTSSNCMNRNNKNIIFKHNWQQFE